MGRTTPSLSRREMHAWPTWSPPSPCASSPSRTTHPSDASPSVTCVKPSLSVSSRRSPSPTKPARAPRSKLFSPFKKKKASPQKKKTKKGQKKKKKKKKKKK